MKETFKRSKSDIRQEISSDQTIKPLNLDRQRAKQPMTQDDADQTQAFVTDQRLLKRSREDSDSVDSPARSQRRHDTILTDTTQKQELDELRKIVSNLEEVEWLDNSQTIFSEESRKALLVQQDNKAHQAQVSPTDRRSSGRSREDSENISSSDRLKRRCEKDAASTGFLPQNQAIDHSKGEIDYNRLIYFLTSEERKNLLSGLSKTYKTPKEHLAIEIFNKVIIRNQQLHKEDRYKEIYGNNVEKWQPDQKTSERTWTTQQLHRLVDEMIQIKDFKHSTFQDFLSEESKAICEQLNKYGKSLNNQEWEDIKTKFEEHNMEDQDKRRRYLRTRTENSRSHQKNRELKANMRALQEGFKDRHHRRKSLKDASETSR
jgi:hypothetical protein